MIDLHYSPTPNGQKVRVLLEELGLPHRIVPLRLSAGEQFAPAFAAISPNQKIPAIVDHAPVDGAGPLALFESGAILVYLAEKAGALLPSTPRARAEALAWLAWQVSGLGPMAGQAGYFRVYAPEPVPFAIARYTRELTRLYGVLEQRLAGRGFVLDSGYSIVDIAIYPWIVPHAPHGQRLDDFPAVARWFRRIGERPAVRRAYDGVVDVYTRPGAPAATAVIPPA